MLALALLPLLAATVSGTPLIPRQASNGTNPSNSTSATSAAQPVVTIYPKTPSGQPIVISGTTSPLLNTDNYLGIPYAAPPVGDLRFTAPQDATWSNGSTLNAVKQPPACLQNSSMYDQYGESEDCLYLNVQTPKGANGSTASLPVMVWVYGGSFTNGAASTYDGSFILAQAQLTKRPVVFVAINYRLGVFGFPQGDEAFANGAANLGLKDVQKSLEWVQENIWAFGGDPQQVTVFGESAGAILISLLYLQKDINLFKGAIMESGAQSTAPIGPTGTTWSEPFDLLTQLAGCSSNSTSGSNSNSSFDCLKALPAEQLLAAQVKLKANPLYAEPFVFSPSIDGDLIPDSPHALLANGQFAQIPFISGNNVDEGTVFTPTPDVISLSNVSVAAAVFASVEPIPPSQEILAQLLTEVYPPDPSVGSPYFTGNETFGFPPEFKQVASILGDAAFQANRRWFLQQANAHGLTQTWSYQYQAAPVGRPAYLGVPHAAEVPYVFGLPQATVLGYLNSTTNYTQADAAVSENLINYWLNFAWYSDPSPSWVNNTANLTSWPQYGSDLNLLTFNKTMQGTVNNTIIPDTYRQKQMQFFLDRPQDFNYRKRSIKVF